MEELEKRVQALEERVKELEEQIALPLDLDKMDLMATLIAKRMTIRYIPVGTNP